MKYFLIIHLFVSSIYSQLDIIYFKDGKVEKGEVSLDGKNVSLKKRFDKNYKFYNTDFINLIKSWNGDIIYPKGILANTSSKTYHLNVEHFEKKKHTIQSWMLKMME